MILNRIRMAAVAVTMVSSFVLITGCDGGNDNQSNTGSQSSVTQQDTDGQSSEGSKVDTKDTKRLPCHTSYPNNSTLDECGLRLQEQTVVEAKLSGPTKIYTEFDSENQVLNTTVNCAAEHCVQPVPANTPVQIICFEGDRFGIVAPPKYIIDQSNVTRYTTSMVGGKHLSGFEGEGAGVPIGFIDHSVIANLDEVSGTLSTKLEGRFGSMSCQDQRIVVTDNMHRNGWNTVQSAKTPLSRG